MKDVWKKALKNGYIEILYFILAGAIASFFWKVNWELYFLVLIFLRTIQIDNKLKRKE